MRVKVRVRSCLSRSASGCSQAVACSCRLYRDLQASDRNSGRQTTADRERPALLRTNVRVNLLFPADVKEHL